MSQDTANLEEIVQKLSDLTILEMSELKKLLEEKWDVKASAAVAVAAGPAVAGDAAGGAPAEEATEFNVTLASIDDSKKIAIIKAVREITGLGLKEAKELVEGAPKELKSGTSKADADEIKSKIEAAGGKVELKGA